VPSSPTTYSTNWDIDRTGKNPRERVERLLARHPYLALRRISCDFSDGLVTLRGCLPSYFLKQMAQTAIAEADGVERIDNRIEVVAAERS